MTFRIWCTVAGGVTGHREAWLKSNGTIVEFLTREEADAEAARLNSRYRGPIIHFNYEVRAEPDWSEEAAEAAQRIADAREGFDDL